MEKLLPYIVAAIVILLAVFIIIRHVQRMAKGQNSCSSCNHDCSSCGLYKSAQITEKDSKDEV